MRIRRGHRDKCAGGLLVGLMVGTVEIPLRRKLKAANKQATQPARRGPDQPWSPEPGADRARYRVGALSGHRTGKV